MSLLSKRISRFQPSVTVQISQKARDLRSKGKDIISLSSGEPDFNTPDEIKTEAIKAIRNNFTKYTPVDGILDLKKAIKKKLWNENKLSYNIDQITVGVGGKHVIYNLFMSTIDDGDEVIIPSPYWVSYPDIVLLCNGKPIILQTSLESRFKITAKQIDEKISKKTKWFIMNSPSNPTGVVYTHNELKEISEVLMKYDHVNILSDDIYEHIIYGEKNFYNLINLEPKLYSRAFIVNGVSKAFSMTGWRIGYGAGSNEIIKSIAKIQSQSTTNPTSISQMAAISALNSEKKFLPKWIFEFLKRRDFIYEKFNKIEGLECIKPDGAFYMFTSCKGILGKKSPDGKVISDDVDFSNFILEFGGVAVVPGKAFGASPYFRISYASSMDLLEKACEKINSAISLLK